MKQIRLPIANTLFGLLLAVVPLIVSKGKYPLLTLVSLLLGLLFLSGGALLYLRRSPATCINRIASLATIAIGLVLIVMLTWSATYIRSIFGALGAVISGTLFMAILAVANLFFIYPGILLYALRNRDPQGKSLSS